MKSKKNISVVIFLTILFPVWVFAREMVCNNFEGIIEPSETVAISSEVEGVVSQIFADRGDMVEKNAPLASLKSGVEQAEIAIATARVAFEKRKDQRSLELFKKKLISMHEKDELETEILIAELQLEEAEERLAQRTLKSPVSGVVVERNLSPGEHISDDAVMIVAQIDPLYVEIVIPVECYGKIRIGQTAVVIIAHPIKKKLNCSVLVVDRVIDAASATFNVRLKLNNPGGKLPAGLRCIVRF